MKERTIGRQWFYGPISIVAALLVVTAWPARGNAQDETLFVRGDVDESLRVNITDAVRILQFLFAGRPDAVGCLDAADTNDDGNVALDDAIFTLMHLFQPGVVLPSPFPHCLLDPTEDTLGCESYSSCEPTIQPFGIPYAASDVVFVVDRSGSMQDSGELARAKQVIAKSLEDLGADASFGIVFFDTGVLKFPSTSELVPATTGNVESALAWLAGVSGGSGSCLDTGLFAGLEYFETSQAKRKAMIYVGDGGGTCRGENEADHLSRTVAQTTEMNGGQVQINAIGVLVGNSRQIQERMLMELAERNGGRYDRIN